MTHTAQKHIKNKSNKIIEVLGSNTIRYPRTMMIKNNDTMIACSTMFRSGRFYYFTCYTFLILLKSHFIIKLRILFNIFIYIFLSNDTWISFRCFDIIILR